ncbi:uncharacterized protein LOC131932172 [Physella acuta]|uniref:uncharacterized protein LOC131932172 n=1 Tax=Physella acuta TaxID=109671 RepID=UPI0027DAFCF2|nr:uncharacterized protein LOC131932172 [Physella acuta]
MTRPGHILNMCKHLSVFVFLLASITNVYCGDALQTTHQDNSTLQHQSKRNVGTTKYPMPYTGEIKHSLYDGKEIIVEGVIDKKPQSFIVELCEKSSCYQDIEMQATYRFHTQRFNLNSRRNFKWGPDKVTDGKLLQEQQAFNMKIVIYSQQIKVFLKSKTFELNGLVRMTKIKYIRIRASAKVHWILFSVGHPT